MSELLAQQGLNDDPIASSPGPDLVTNQESSFNIFVDGASPNSCYEQMSSTNLPVLYSSTSQIITGLQGMSRTRNGESTLEPHINVMDVCMTSTHSRDLAYNRNDASVDQIQIGMSPDEQVLIGSCLPDSFQVSSTGLLDEGYH